MATRSRAACGRRTARARCAPGRPRAQLDAERARGGAGLACHELPRRRARAAQHGLSRSAAAARDRAVRRDGRAGAMRACCRDCRNRRWRNCAKSSSWAGEPPPDSVLRIHSASVLEGAERPKPGRPVSPGTRITSCCTSGTTGPSKARAVDVCAGVVGDAMGMDYFDADDRLLANLPLFHVSGAGAVMDRLTKGGTCVLVDGFSRRAFWDTVRRFRDHRRLSRGRDDAVPAAAAAERARSRPPAAQRRDRAVEPGLAGGRRAVRAVDATAFNMTETAVPIRSAANPAVLGTCGQPRAGIEARVVDARTTSRCRTARSGS